MTYRYFRFFSFIFLIISILGYSSCGKQCGDPQTITDERFTNDYNWLMNFSGNETLAFRKNKNDTVLFTGQGLESYFEMISVGGGNCEINHKELNHRVKFSNTKEGDIVVHYYKNLDNDTYELMSKNIQLVKPVSTFNIFFGGLDSNLIFNSKKYNLVRQFSNNGDSIYINVSNTDNPITRIIRMKINKDIYEVIP